MSICPNKNVLSLYVDNELTPTLKRDFESHMKDCESCTKQVSQYANLSKNLQLFETNYDLEEGYKRLKVRQSYKAHLAPFGIVRDSSFMFKLTPVFAAVAILAVFFPLSRLFSDMISKNQSAAVIDNGSSIGYLLPSVNSVQIAPMQQKGVVFDDAIAQLRMTNSSTFMNSIEIDATKLTEFDVFKPVTLKNNTPIEIILFDSPATVLHQTDRFGLSQPVFLLRE